MTFYVRKNAATCKAQSQQQCSNTCQVNTGITPANHISRPQVPFVPGGNGNHDYTVKHQFTTFLSWLKPLVTSLHTPIALNHLCYVNDCFLCDLTFLGLFCIFVLCDVFVGRANQLVCSGANDITC